MSPEEKVRLTHIVEAATLIASYINGVSKDEFLSNPMRQDAVMRRIQIIGEAVRHLSREVVASPRRAQIRDFRFRVPLHFCHGA
jgi:uncharacterized protein with HEPN domain